MDGLTLKHLIQQVGEIAYATGIISFFLTMTILLIGCFYFLYIDYIFFPKFERKYRLNELFSPTSVAYENKMKSEYAKILILSKLAVGYLSSDWLFWRHRSANKFFKKCEEMREVYYFACRNLIDKDYVIKDPDSMYWLERLGIIKEHMLEKELKVFLIYNRMVNFLICTGSICVVSGIIYKYIVPDLLKNFF